MHQNLKFHLSLHDQISRTRCVQDMIFLEKLSWLSFEFLARSYLVAVGVFFIFTEAGLITPDEGPLWSSSIKSPRRSSFARLTFFCDRKRLNT